MSLVHKTGAAAMALLVLSAVVIYSYAWGGGEPAVTAPPPSSFDVQKERYMNSDEGTAYVTPAHPSLAGHPLASLSPEELYLHAARSWIWVTDKTLYGTPDYWAAPQEFLLSSPSLATNPLPGSVVGDCEDQAFALATLLRMGGMPASDVRVGIGQVKITNPATGLSYVGLHAWVEIWWDSAWMALDPSMPTYWEASSENVVCRDVPDFTHYAVARYPIMELWAYMSDEYYWCALNGYGTAPAFWKE